MGERPNLPIDSMVNFDEVQSCRLNDGTLNLGGGEARLKPFVEHLMGSISMLRVRGGDGHIDEASSTTWRRRGSPWFG